MAEQAPLVRRVHQAVADERDPAVTGDLHPVQAGRAPVRVLAGREELRAPGDAGRERLDRQRRAEGRGTQVEVPRAAGKADGERRPARDDEGVRDTMRLEREPGRVGGRELDTVVHENPLPAHEVGDRGVVKAKRPDVVDERPVDVETEVGVTDIVRGEPAEHHTAGRSMTVPLLDRRAVRADAHEHQGRVMDTTLPAPGRMPCWQMNHLETTSTAAVAILVAAVVQRWTPRREFSERY